jgi:hypothetical protein
MLNPIFASLINSYFFAFGAGAPFFRAAHRAFIAAASLALPAAVMPPLFFPVPALAGVAALAAPDDPPFVLAQRAR